MNLAIYEKVAALRAEIRAFLAEKLPP